MTTQWLYQTLLTLHIACFVTAIGTLVLSVAAYNQFWRLYGIDKEQGKSAFRSFLNTRKVGMYGLFFALLAGIAMEVTAGGAHSYYLWFKIKMCLIVCLFINGFTLGRTATLNLQKLVEKQPGDPFSEEQIEKLKKRTRLFQLTQLFIYGCIIVMAAFRFN